MIVRICSGSKKVFIYANDTEMSARIEKLLRMKLVKSGLRVYEQLEADTALIIVSAETAPAALPQKL